jgi:hypothetical protein
MNDVELFSLKNPLFREVFIDILKNLSLDGETAEISIAALKLQVAIQHFERSKTCCL